MAQKRVRRTKAEIAAGVTLEDKAKSRTSVKKVTKAKAKTPAKKEVKKETKTVIPTAKKKAKRKKKSDNWKTIELTSSKKITIGALDKLYEESWRFAFAQENKDGNLELFFQKDNSVQK
jgi:hypothetical protein